MANSPNATNQPAATNQPINEQIEAAADYYEPALYELLTFYSALQLQNDEASGQFIPLTSVKDRRPSEVKIFAVGLIPPSANISGRLLDRSATVATLEGPPKQQGAIDTSVDQSGVKGTGSVPMGPKSSSDPNFWPQFVAMSNRLGCEADALAQVIQSESGFHPDAIAWRDKDGKQCARGLPPYNPQGDSCQPVAKGLNQLTFATAVGVKQKDGTFKQGLGMSPEEWATYEQQSDVQQLKWVEKYMQGVGVRGKTAAQIYCSNFGSYNNPNGSMYDGSIPKQAAAYKANIGLDKGKKGYITPDDLASSMRPLAPGRLAAINAARSGLGMSAKAVPKIAGDAQAANAWQGNGSNNAGEAAKNLAQTSGKNLNLTGLGKQFLGAQLATIKELQRRIDDIKNTPPLRLLVNPTSFKNGLEKILNDGNWGRNGPIVEHWGEQQDKLEASGKVAAFYSLDAVGGPNQEGDAGNGPGLGRTARQFSASYQNLLSLWLIYKNNGGIWLSDLTEAVSTKPKSLYLLGSVYIYYDDILYIGSFDSFNLNEEEGVPFSLTYDFSFTVRASFLLDRTSVSPLEASQGTPYGASQFFQGQFRPPTTGSPTSPLSSTPTNNPQPSPNVALPPGIAADIAAQRGSSTGSRGGA
jgi:hypothetical protein